MRQAVLFFALLSLLSGGAVADVPSKPNREDPSGRWVGEYTNGRKRVFLIIRVRKENGNWVGTYNRPELDWENFLDLKNLRIQSNTISFDMEETSSAIHVDTRWVSGSLHGTIRGKGASGTIVLEPTATLSKDYMDTLAGDYENAAGDSYVIERENNYLCFLNRRTGRSGRLMPASETEFWSGPSMDIWYPREIGFNFAPGTEGRGMLLKVRGRDKQRPAMQRRALYTEEDIEFENAGAKLAGTLRIAREEHPRPAVVILHGSNYQTRGGQYGALAFVADQFARNGFVALTYDKRGTGKSSGQRDDDPDLLSGDAAAAIELLRGRSEVDPNQIGLWGISQGGILEPLVAEKAGRIAFFINVSGAVINTNEQEIQRTELKLRADGFSAEDVVAAVHLQQAKFRYACRHDNWSEYEALLNSAKGKAWLPDPYIGPPESKEDSAWIFWKCGVEPGNYWEHVTTPVLYIQGEFEAYSDPHANLARLQEALQAAGNARFEHMLLPGAEHSMFRARNGGEKELPFLNTYVDGYFSLLTDWARRQVTLPSSKTK